MLFSFFDLLWPALSLFFHSLIFFLLPPLLSPMGSPNARQEVEAGWFPPARLSSLVPPHLFTFLCPYLENSRSPLATTPALPLPLYRVQTPSWQ